MIAFVTGANGFVGRAVSRALLAEGWTVRGGIRHEAGRSAIVADVEPVVIGNLAMQPAFSQALKGTDVVVHLAARTHVLRDAATDPEREYAAINVDGTRALAEAAAGAGVRRVVFMSSIKVLGERTTTPFDDHTPPAPEDAYGRTKLEAERTLARTLDGTSTDWCVLRPPLVYGAGVRGNFPRLVGLARLGRRVPLPFAAVRNRRSLIHVSHLAEAVTECLTSAAAARETFVVADAPPRSTPELLSAIGAALGLNVMLVSAPASLIRTVATLAGRANEARRLLESLEVDASRFRAKTGWRPTLEFSEAIRDALAQDDRVKASTS